MNSPHQRLLAEWDAEHNAPLTPDDVSFCSARRVWWRCTHCSYAWQQSVAYRTSKPHIGCQRCNPYGRRRAVEISPVNDQKNWRRFATMSDIAVELKRSPAAVRQALYHRRNDGKGLLRICAGHVLRYAD